MEISPLEVALAGGGTCVKPAHACFPGFFFTFEGVDGCGKSVQCERLAAYLGGEGIPFLTVRDPGGTTISEAIRSLLLDERHVGMAAETELLLYEAARAQLVKEKILPALAEGKVVLSDRFIDSTVAYQGYGRGVEIRRVSEANRLGALDLLPDRTYLLDIDWEDSLARRLRQGKTADRMERDLQRFFVRVRKGYLRLAQKDPGRICLLDGRRPLEDLEREIREDALATLRRGGFSVSLGLR